MTDLCIYCHNEVNYDEADDQVQCLACRQWMKVIYFDKEHKKLETAKKEAEKYKEELRQIEAQKKCAIEEKNKAEKLLHDTLSELNDISVSQSEIQDDLATHKEAQARLENLVQRINATSETNSVSLRRTALMLSAIVETQHTTDDRLSSLGHVVAAMLKHDESTEEKIDNLVNLAQKLTGSQQDVTLRAAAMGEYMQKLGSDITQNSALMQDIYHLFQQTNEKETNLLTRISDGSIAFKAWQSDINQRVEGLGSQVRVINEKLETANKEINAFHKEYQQDKIEKLTRMNSFASGLMAEKEYESAEEKYQEIIENGADNLSELYFRKLLCKYGVEYVRSDYMGTYVPTMYNVNMLDEKRPEETSDIKPILANATGDQRAYYEQKIKEIGQIVDAYRQVKLDSDYDVFISVKQQDNGLPTKDSEEAGKLYNILTTKYHLKVFNSKYSEIPAGEAYEPYILAALRSAKLMIVVAGKKDYAEAPWVANEWGRFLWLINNEKRKYGNSKRKLVFYLCDNMKPSTLPRKAQGLQAIEEGFGAEASLRAVIRKLFPESITNNQSKNESSTPANDDPPAPQKRRTWLIPVLTTAVLILTIFLFFVLTKSHQHVWRDATCTEPMTCVICGETAGLPLGHNYAPATYEQPSTCRICGITKGDKLQTETPIVQNTTPTPSPRITNTPTPSPRITNTPTPSPKVTDTPTPSTRATVKREQTPVSARKLGTGIIRSGTARCNDYYRSNLYSYPPENAFDGDPETSWLCWKTTKDTNGIYVSNTWNLQGSYKSDYDACGITIRIGLQYREGKPASEPYNSNARPRKITITVNGQSYTKTLIDQMAEQEVLFDSIVRPQNGAFDVKVTVTSVWYKEVANHKEASVGLTEYAIAIADIDLLLKPHD